MGKYLKMMGYLILIFILLSNFIKFDLSNTIIIILGVLSAILISIGIFINDKKLNKISK